jgi:hypothetical protein
MVNFIFKMHDNHQKALLRRIREEKSVPDENKESQTHHDGVRRSGRKNLFFIRIISMTYFVSLQSTQY